MGIDDYDGDGNKLIIEYFEEGFYKNGKLDGKYEVYQEGSNGKKYLMESKNYLNGQLDGKHEKNYEDLELYFHGFEDKEFCFTYKDGELIEEYFNDFHLSTQTNHGFRKYYKKGKKIKEATWNQVMKYPVDTINVTKYFDNNGKIIDSKTEIIEIEDEFVNDSVL